MAVRVLSYPPRHDYVDRLHGAAAELVLRDEEWPRLPRFHDPDWVGRSAHRWDVAHLHFTWEQYPVERLQAVLDAHRRSGVPVVWTAHDLRNPHTAAADDDEPYLRVLARAADRVLTLTAGAAAEVGRRFGRTAEVVPHGPLLTPASPRRRPVRDGVPRLLLHGKSLRANLDWRPVVDAVRRLNRAGGVLRLDLLVHEGHEHRLAGAAGDGVRVVPHRPLTLAQLCEALTAADGLVLPYRWGTHSGLLELAADLGVPVVAADVGHLREQAPALLHPPGDPEQALRRFAAGERPPSVDPGQRVAELDRLQSAHRRLYADLVG